MDDENQSVRSGLAACSLAQNDGRIVIVTLTCSRSGHACLLRQVMCTESGQNRHTMSDLMYTFSCSTHSGVCNIVGGPEAAISIDMSCGPHHTCGCAVFGEAGRRMRMSTWWRY